MKLTIRQEKFAREYVLTGNASEAYRRAYPKSLKWKDSAVYSQSSTLLSSSKVSERVAELAEKSIKRFEINADNVLQEIASIAFADIKNVFDNQGRLIPIHSLTPGVSKSIASVKIKTLLAPGSDPVDVEHITEIKFWDKGANLERLGKHLKLFNEVGSKENPFCLDELTDEQLMQRIAARKKQLGVG
jgi:phage terminase small subunit